LGQLTFPHFELAARVHDVSDYMY